jgi:hypothetical protein
MSDMWHAFGQWFFFSDMRMSPLALVGYGSAIVWIARWGRS